MRVQTRAYLVAVFGVPLVALYAVATEDALEGEFSVIAPLASESMLLDATSVDGLAAVVGERGHVLLSTDGGESWRQISVSTRATLTGVYFHDRDHGWAVGHDAVILRTDDGGESWELVYSAPERNQPLLDVWFQDEQRGFAIGSYGYFLTTEDGGRTWSEQFLTAEMLEAPGSSMDPAGESGEEREWWELDEQDFSEGIDVHLNHIARSESGRLYLGAEAGAVFRSDDEGATWVALPSPYEGSFFGTLPLDGDTLLLFGLRGHLFRSEDAGLTWQPIETSTVAMLTGGLRLGDGTIIITGLAGTVLVSRDGGQSFVLYQQADRNGISTLLPGSEEALILVGEAGVRLLPRSEYSGSEPSS